MPNSASEFDADVLAILACPVCDGRPKLQPSENDEEFLCTECGGRYPIIHGIPQLAREDVISEVER